MSDDRKEEAVSESSGKFFDEKVHKLDPHRRVAGSGAGHVWEETVGELDLEVALPDQAAKANLLVKLGTSSISVSCEGKELWGGPLHGRIVPSDSSWAIEEPDPLARIRGKRLHLSLLKAHGSSDIWATVLDREFISKRQS